MPESLRVRCKFAFRSCSVLCSLVFFLTILQEETLGTFLRRGSADGREEDVSRNLAQQWVLPPEVASAYYLEYFGNPVSQARRLPSTHSWPTRVWRYSQMCRDLTRTPIAFSGIFSWCCLFPQVQYDMEALTLPSPFTT